MLPAPVFKTYHMSTKPVIPSFGHDWLTGCEGKYIILSLKYSNEQLTMFWRGRQHGYSDTLAGAGLYEEWEIKLIFRHLGNVEVAAPIPCTREAFTALGLYPVVADYRMLGEFQVKHIAETQE